MKSWGDWLIESLFCFCFLFCFLFYRVHIRIYVLSLLFFFYFLFFVYSIHINHFFLLFHIARIYVIFFRIRIDVLIVLESIIICFIGYFYNTKWKNMTYTQTKLLRSRVLCEEMQSFSEGGEIKRQKYLPFFKDKKESLR